MAKKPKKLTSQQEEAKKALEAASAKSAAGECPFC